MASGHMIVELFNQNTGAVIASVTVPDGSPACLTGAIDLPVGDSTICIRMHNSDWEGSGNYDGAGLQVIVGQTVDNQGCIPAGGGGCGST